MKEETLGDYRLIKRIGQGSLGTVWLAEHKFMKKQFALKVLPEELAFDRSFVQRFEEEVSWLAGLDHPGLVKMHNVSFAQGSYFLVTDCVVDTRGESTNLAQYLASLPAGMSEETITSILMQIAEALDYAHSKVVGLRPAVHGQLKLNNILIGSEKTPQVAISDFGLSFVVGVGAVLSRTYKTVADALSIRPVVTGSQQEGDRYPQEAIPTAKLTKLHTSFLQNYFFLAPEQKIVSLSNQTSQAADCYAFGVLAYYLLTREFPDGLFSMPSQLEQVSAGWDELVSQCLQRNPASRPQSLVAAMQEAVGGAPKMRAEKQEAIVVSQPQPRQMRTYQIRVPQPAQQPVFAARAASAPPPDTNEAIMLDTAVKPYHPSAADVGESEPILTEMVVIQGGDYLRGSKEGNRDEVPVHRVTVENFALDVHPVTNEQFVRFLAYLGGIKDANNNDIIRLRESRIRKGAGKTQIESGYSKHPVVGVTWYGAVAYAEWVGKRLPTEAEWEIATRGGIENASFATGETVEKSQANFFSSDTTPVMSYAPNAYGLYDMAGNVYEWCQDWYGYTYYEESAQEPDNPKGPLQGVYRVLRGGCWKSLKEDLRCAHRHRNNPGMSNGTSGFRCAADVL